MARRGHDRLQPLWRAIGDGLAADGWRRADEDGWARGYARDAGEGLRLSLGLYTVPFERTEVLVADITIACPAAHKLLKRLGSVAASAIPGEADVDVELDVALDPAAAAPEVTAAVREGVAALMREAGTVDAFVACVPAKIPAHLHAAETLAAVLAVSGRKDEARAALAEADPAFARGLNAWLDGEPLPPNPLSFSLARARANAERAAVAAMEALGPYADAAARRAALVEALAARGLEKSPYWIQLQVDRTRPQGSRWRDFVRDTRRFFRELNAIGDESADYDGYEPEPRGRGPWLEVTLDGDAHVTLARVFERAEIRLMTQASVTAQLRPEADGEPATVLLDGVAVGRRAAPVADETRARAQIGKLAGPDRWHLQVQLP